MSLLKGSMTLRRFMVLGPVPDDSDLQAGLVQDQFRPFQDGLEEERFGWCDWRNLLLTPPDENWVIQERFAVFGLRLDTRKVPPATLAAHVDLRLQNMMKEKDLAFVGKEARISIQDEVKVELLKKVFPTAKVAEVAWDRKNGIVWSTASSDKMAGLMASLFIKSFGVELHPLAYLVNAGRIRPTISTEALMSLDPLEIGVEEEVHS